ncbi:MAG: uracil-DNA glycosylase [Ignavibacteria bacterium]|nr:uracil-DNA glycosylase [Ignavibacteria bacterium]
MISQETDIVSEKVVGFNPVKKEGLKNEAAEKFEEKKIDKEKIKDGKPDFTEINKLKDTVSNCFKCRDLSQLRNNVVFGSGNENADLVIVGEAPGAEEDKQGLPFVGRAGKLLTDILKAINFSREEVYICNILKCRPPENRNPMADEIENCEPYLFNQLKLIKPKLILSLGTFASQTLLRSKEPLGKLRGRFHSYEGIKMMVTYHPAALLRNPAWKKPTWEDVQMLRAEYDIMKNN